MTRAPRVFAKPLGPLLRTIGELAPPPWPSAAAFSGLPSPSGQAGVAHLYTELLASAAFHSRRQRRPGSVIALEQGRDPPTILLVEDTNQLGKW